MIDPYLLTEIVTFKATGTLAATAKQLNVTQPTVTRGMQKLEDTLQVQLFDRQPNRISLTATGELVAQEAAILLAQQTAFVDKVRRFDQQQAQLLVSSTVPGPLLMLQQIQSQLAVPVKIDDHLNSLATVTAQLQKHQFNLIFTHKPIETATITASLLGTEQLFVNLDQFMRQANQATISFAELTGLSFLVLHDIGVWRDIIQAKIPNAKFLYQAEHAALRELTQYSNFPYFSSNLSYLDANSPIRRNQADDRVSIPISDDQAQMPIYACYLKQNTLQIKPLIKLIQQNWPK